MNWLTFSWLHTLFFLSFPWIFLSDAWLCWNKHKVKLHPTNSMQLMFVWCKKTNIGFSATSHLQYRLEIHLALQNIVHSFQGRHSKLELLDLNSTLTPISNMRSRTGKKQWFVQVPKSNFWLAFRIKWMAEFSELLKPNYFKKQCSSSSFFLT